MQKCSQEYTEEITKHFQNYRHVKAVSKVITLGLIIKHMHLAYVIILKFQISNIHRLCFIN
jgi:hypothetical protein